MPHGSGDNDETVVSRRSARGEAPVVSEQGDDDRTVVSVRRSATKPPSAGGPGRLSGGRVASVPGPERMRYQSRAIVDLRVEPSTASTATRLPESPVRPVRGTTAVDVAQHGRRRRQGILLLSALIASVALAAIVIAVVFRVLSAG